LIAEIQQSIPLADRREWPTILGWQLRSDHPCAVAQKSGSVGVGRDLRSVAVDDQPGDHGGHSAAVSSLGPFIPTSEELRPGRQYIVYGTLLPYWSWASAPGLYSGKHKTTGMNVQVVCTLDGELVWISDPIEGARHDLFCLDESRALDGLIPAIGPATKAMSAETSSRR
jgi:hypothetical protein